MTCIKIKYLVLPALHSYVYIPVRDEGIAISGGCFEDSLS